LIAVGGQIVQSHCAIAPAAAINGSRRRRG